MTLKQYLDRELPALEEELKRRVSHRGIYESRVWEAMDYSLMAGGKRIRPLMLQLSAWAVSGGGLEACIQKVRPFAISLEMLHTYSLIHDDLPAMDNDDYRRGRKTNHKVYGEAVAILAGDGLLNLAYETLLDAVCTDPTPGKLEAARTIAHAAGALGMVAGQTADMLAEQQKATREHLDYIEENKTGQLMMASLVAGAQAAGGSPAQIQAMRDAGRAMGKAFQIQDDILDVEGTQEELGKPAGSDEENDKVTFVTLYGLEEARRMTAELSHKACQSLEGFDSEAGVLLREWIRTLIYRKK